MFVSHTYILTELLNHSAKRGGVVVPGIAALQELESCWMWMSQPLTARHLGICC